MEINDKKDQRDDVFSRHVRAGKRTYFFDVKATRADDYYLTITESTKKIDENGSFFYKKHRIFLYKEDFNKFSDSLSEVIGFVHKEKGEAPIRSNNHESASKKENTGNEVSVENNLNSLPVPESEKEEPSSNENNQIVDDAHEEAINKEEGQAEDNENISK
ncbi:MAG TPA: DUF3276 family protein [Flavobacteriales bacterium]|nr:DUF3276 family protein [Flavobacteriales bacterium]